MANPKYKLPKDPRYRKQVKTFIANNGREKYAELASAAGRKSPTKFTSETGRAAVMKRHQMRREKEAQAREENSNGKKQQSDSTSEEPKS